MPTHTDTPETQDELAARIQECYEQEIAIFPLGGQTSLDYGMPIESDGRGLCTKALQKVIDYPTRDTTITVEAGMTLAELQSILRPERQWLPWDVTHPDKATLGGIVATNTNGPRRYKYGTVRDFIIGISAIDGRGTPFKAGGRVVKNVAGYDFCKLLTGSLGTLGIITQLTFKLVPIPECRRWVMIDVDDLKTVETVLSNLVTSRTYPSAIELLSGSHWQLSKLYRVAVCIEGTTVEVDFMEQQLKQEWKAVAEMRTFDTEDSEHLLKACTDFPASRAGSVTLKANVLPSRVTEIVDTAEQLDRDVNLLADAGDGVVYLQLMQQDLPELTASIHALRAQATAAHGNLVVWGHRIDLPADADLFCGALGPELETMWKVKRTFDPKNLLNPNRFIFTGTPQPAQ